MVPTICEEPKAGGGNLLWGTKSRRRLISVIVITLILIGMVMFLFMDPTTQPHREVGILFSKAGQTERRYSVFMTNGPRVASLSGPEVQYKYENGRLLWNAGASGQDCFLLQDKPICSVGIPYGVTEFRLAFSYQERGWFRKITRPINCRNP
jgi:hypothetical protein